MFTSPTSANNLLTLAVLFSAFLALPSPAKADVRIFLSTSSTSPTIASPTMQFGGPDPGSLYIWVIPGDNGVVGAVGGIGLSLLTEIPGIVTGVSTHVYQAEQRWDIVHEGEMGELVTNLETLSLTSPGITAAHQPDDPATGAYLHARVDFSREVLFGDADLYLQVSDLGISTNGATDRVYFGDEDTALEALPGARGSVADARIWVDYIIGDMNQDGRITALDIAPFVLGLLDPAAYEERYGFDPTPLGDINGDGVFDSHDIGPFIELLFNPPPWTSTTSVPEPATALLVGVGSLLLLRRR